METLYTPFELKFAQEPSSGHFEGYGSIIGTVDSHGDVVLPGCFGRTLAEHKGRGSMPHMFVQHSAFLPGGDLLPVGRWLDIVEDSRGLHCRGKLSAPDTEHHKRIRGLMEDGALPGLSIAFAVPEGGAVYGKGKGEPKRQLKSVDLIAIDIVHAPSNADALIHSLKSIMVQADHQTATAALRSAIQMCSDCLGGGDSPTSDERNAIIDNLQTAHKALHGGEPFMPQPALRFSNQRDLRDQLPELRKFLHRPRDEGGCGLSARQADELATFVCKSAASRDENSGDARAAQRAAAAELSSMFAGFSLPK
jgi:HK97 family phage prohead protease